MSNIDVATMTDSDKTGGVHYTDVMTTASASRPRRQRRSGARADRKPDAARDDTRANAAAAGVGGTGSNDVFNTVITAIEEVAAGALDVHQRTGRTDRSRRRVTASAACEEAWRVIVQVLIAAAMRRRGLATPAADRADVVRVRSCVEIALTPAVERALIDLEIEPGLIASLHERVLGMQASEDRIGSRVRMQAQRTSRRRSQGSFYTPDVLVTHVLDVALTPLIERARAAHQGESLAQALLGLRVCDPACGTGNFLIAAARRIALEVHQARGERGGTRGLARAMRETIGQCVFGMDIDATAVEICIASLAIEAGSADGVALPQSRVSCGDALAMNAFAQHVGGGGGGDPSDGFDCVVGNPPFLNQLQHETAATRKEARRLRERFGGAVKGYADVAGAFLLLGVEIARSGGMIAMVQPRSLLASRDGAGVRAALLREASLRSLWAGDQHAFDASVFTCVPAFEKRGESSAVMCVHDARTFQPRTVAIESKSSPRADRGWAYLLAETAGVPTVTFTHSDVVGDRAEVTADFRDQYYGLKGCIAEQDRLEAKARQDWQAWPMLVTTGLIDLAHCAWGRRSTRILRTAWHAPRLDADKLRRTTSLAAWLDARMRPKIMLATQTKVIEVVVDEHGTCVPVVPLITIVPRDARDMWRIAAALASPVTTSVALREYGGTAMTADAIKLAARQVAAMPLPRRCDAWEQAAQRFRDASRCDDAGERSDLLMAVAGAMLEAFEVPEAQHVRLMAWWSARAATRRHDV